MRTKLVAKLTKKISRSKIDIDVVVKNTKTPKVAAQVFLEQEIADKIASMGSPNVSIGRKIKAILKHLFTNKEIKIKLK